MQIWQAFSKHPFQFFPQTETNRYHPHYKPGENNGVTFPAEEESKKKMKEDIELIPQKRKRKQMQKLKKSERKSTFHLLFHLQT